MTPEICNLVIPRTELLAEHTITYYRWGDPILPPIICLHGLTRNGRDFDFLAQALMRDYCVFCPDMPGRGQSAWLADPLQYHYGTYVADMLAMVAMLKLRPLHWVGTSMGGIIGMMLANAAPGVIRSLTLNDIGCSVSAKGLKRISQYAGINTIFPDAATAETALRANLATFGITDEMHWQHMLNNSLYRMGDGTVRLAYDPAIMVNFPKGEDIKDIDLWGLWEAIKPLPAMLIRGETSDLLSPETALQMQQAHPALTYKEISGTGHAPALMNEAQVSFIADWLRTQIT